MPTVRHTQQHTLWQTDAELRGGGLRFKTDPPSSATDHCGFFQPLSEDIEAPTERGRWVPGGHAFSAPPKHVSARRGLARKAYALGRKALNELGTLVTPAHWECLTATDFLSVEVHTIKGLVTYYILFFIDIPSRSAHIAGITSHPDNRWMAQVARNVTDLEEGFLRGKRYLILDRDTKYSDEFRNVLTREGIHLIRLPARSPNFKANASYCLLFG